MAREPPQLRFTVPDTFELPESELTLVGDRLGAGGCGQVLKGTWRGFPVAVKFILPANAQDPKEAKAFKTEYKAMMQLNHPYVIHVYGVCHMGDGRVALVEELAEGDLRKRIAGKPMPLADICRYGYELAEALAFCHSRCVTHNDVKPLNVMCFGANQPSKLSDFGLVCSLRGGRKGAVDLGTVRAGVGASGTPGYMAPEVLKGEGGKCPKADVYAMGLVLYELATGLNPQEDGDVLRGKPGSRPAMPASVDTRIKSLIQAAWAESADDRPTAAQVADFLKRVAKGDSSPDLPHGGPVAPSFFLFANDGATVLGVSHSQQHNGTDAVFGLKHGRPNQQWVFEPSSQPGYFFIHSLLTPTLVLDWSVGPTPAPLTPGTKVHMWEKSGGDHQLWKLVPAALMAAAHDSGGSSGGGGGGGTFYLVNKRSDSCVLDWSVPNAENYPACRMVALAKGGRAGGSDKQTLHLELCTPTAVAPPLSSLPFLAVPSMPTNVCFSTATGGKRLQVADGGAQGAVVLPAVKRETSNQLWGVLPKPEGGYFEIVNSLYPSHRLVWCMASVGHVEEDRAVMSWESHGGDNQLWRLVPNGSGFAIMNRCSALHLLDSSDGMLRMRRKNMELPSQRWILEFHGVSQHHSPQGSPPAHPHPHPNPRPQPQGPPPLQHPHALSSAFGLGDHRTCAICRGTTGPFMSCRPCSYDECLRCFAKNYAAAAAGGGPSPPSPALAPAPSPRFVGGAGAMPAASPLPKAGGSPGGAVQCAPV